MIWFRAELFCCAVPVDAPSSDYMLVRHALSDNRIMFHLWFANESTALCVLFISSLPGQRLWSSHSNVLVCWSLGVKLLSYFSQDSVVYVVKYGQFFSSFRDLPYLEVLM